MCTLSWVRHDQGYTVFFNRDERRTRSAGLPPSEQAREGVRFVAPIDPEGGGSWAAVNQHGVGLCLLNQYGLPVTMAEDGVSRGQLVIALAPRPSQTAVLREVRRTGLARYAPFRLAVFEPAMPALLLGWDGQRLTETLEGHSGLLATSSSVAQEAADLNRRALFERVVADGTVTEEVFDRLHRSHIPGRGALSVCMHRDDAATVSLTRIAVTPEAVRLGYVAGAPCEGAPEVIVSLPAAREAAQLR